MITRITTSATTNGPMVDGAIEDDELSEDCEDDDDDCEPIPVGLALARS